MHFNHVSEHDAVMLSFGALLAGCNWWLREVVFVSLAQSLGKGYRGSSYCVACQYLESWGLHRKANMVWSIGMHLGATTSFRIQCH